MNRTRKRGRRRRKKTRRRKRGGFKFKKPKLLGKMADMGKTAVRGVATGTRRAVGAVGTGARRAAGAVGTGARRAAGAVGTVGRRAAGAAMKNPLMAMGGLGASAALLASMGGIPMGQFSKIAKIGGMMVAPLLLLGSFLKPGAKFVYQGLKQVVTVAMKSGKGGFTFIINMVGMPIKALMGLLGNMPMLMAGLGGFAGIAMLVGKGYLSWIAKTWRWLADGWASAPLFTWCEKREDGTCRCPQILRIKKEGGEAKIVVEDKKQESSAEGKGCFMNRQCSGGLICKKKHAWSPRGKCTQPGVESAKPKKGFLSSGEGKGCFMNKQCPSGFVCKKSKWSPRGKCTQSGIAGVTPASPMVTPPQPIVESAPPLVSNQPIQMEGGGRLKTMWRLEGETTGNGILIKINNIKKSRKRRTRRKRGGTACPPPDAKTGKDKEWYREVGNCVAIRQTASGRTYKARYPKDRACCPGDNYECIIEGNGDEREATCRFTGAADPDMSPPPTIADVAHQLAQRRA